MVNSRKRNLDETLFALSDPLRRKMVERLTRGDLPVATLARPFRVSAPAISKHLRVLERAGLVTQRRAGRMRLCHLEPQPMKAVVQWIERYRQFWEGQLDQFVAYVETQHKGKKP